MAAEKKQKLELGTVQKQYTEYKLDVEIVTKSKDGATVYSHHLAEFGKPVRTKIRIEPSKANALNSKWHTRNLYLVQDDEYGEPAPKPEKIKRRYWNDQEKDNGEAKGEWKDEFFYAKTTI